MSRCRSDPPGQRGATVVRPKHGVVLHAFCILGCISHFSSKEEEEEEEELEEEEEQMEDEDSHCMGPDIKISPCQAPPTLCPDPTHLTPPQPDPTRSDPSTPINSSFNSTSCSSAAGSPSPLQSDSTSHLLTAATPSTPPLPGTHEVPGSSHNPEPTSGPPPGPTQGPTNWPEGVEPGRGGAKSEEEQRKRRRQQRRQADGLRPRLLGPPLQGGAGELLSQLRSVGGAMEEEVGGARGLWRAVLPANWRDVKTRTGEHRSAAGDDVIEHTFQDVSLPSGRKC